jgi:hypothetical protein
VTHAETFTQQGLIKVAYLQQSSESFAMETGEGKELVTCGDRSHRHPHGRFQKPCHPLRTVTSSPAGNAPRTMAGLRNLAICALA